LTALQDFSMSQDWVLSVLVEESAHKKC
jgi:hypothetical protein